MPKLKERASKNSHYLHLQGQVLTSTATIFKNFPNIFSI